MKVTKSQLKRIIKEEMAKALNELEEVPPHVNKMQGDLAIDALVNLIKHNHSLKRQLDVAFRQVVGFYDSGYDSGYPYMFPITNYELDPKAEEIYNKLEVEGYSDDNKDLLIGVNNVLAYHGVRAGRDQHQIDAIERVILRRVEAGAFTMGDL